MTKTIIFAFEQQVEKTQIVGSLLNGHTLVISSQDCPENIQKFLGYINEKKINYFQCTPSFADNLDYKKLKYVHTVAVAREKIPKSLFYNTHKNNIRLVNVCAGHDYLFVDDNARQFIQKELDLVTMEAVFQ